MTSQLYYDSKYFAWQKAIGEFGGWANKTKFAAFISKEDVVLDFGCGGGYLLKNIDCKKKIGVEINSSAHETARENGLEIYQFLDNVPDNYVDKIISNNALEHTHHPLEELKKLQTKLRNSGKIIFIVPCENISYKYKPEDVNQHLYSWSPMCIGNLFTLAGFSVIEVKPYIHKWPPHYMKIAKLGRKIFNFVCKIYGQYERTWFQIRIVAEKN
ncbi:MAG: class I SAM-dependent methyltransferase [Spirochaetaceae bacterium]|nr:class I SAM-dependent methyltransferase [Spirochaetaceae bacterium]